MSSSSKRKKKGDDDGGDDKAITKQPSMSERSGVGGVALKGGAEKARKRRKKKAKGEGNDPGNVKEVNTGVDVTTDASVERKKRKKQQMGKHPEKSTKRKNKEGEGEERPLTAKWAKSERTREASESSEEQAEILLDSFRNQTAGDASQVEPALAPSNLVVSSESELSLSERLKRIIPDWESTICCQQGERMEPGRPRLVVVCNSSARGYDVLEKELNDWIKLSRRRPAKLCTKGLKLKDQREFLRKAEVCIAAGTPARLQQLEEAGSLDLGGTAVFLLDLRPDLKRRTLANMEPTARQFWECFSSVIAPRVLGGSSTLAIVA